jgi:hypothetical protein
LSFANLLGSRHTRYCRPAAFFVVSYCSERFPCALAAVFMRDAGRVVQEKPYAVGRQIQGMVNPMSSVNEVVAKRIVFTSIHARTIASYRHFASGSCTTDVMKSPAIVLPGVDLKLKRSGQTIPNRKTEIR